MFPSAWWLIHDRFYKTNSVKCFCGTFSLSARQPQASKSGPYQRKSQSKYLVSVILVTLSLAQTCRAAWLLANGSADQHLWRQLFLLFPFDDTGMTCQGLRKDIPFDWKTELQRRVRAETITRRDRSMPQDLHAALVVILGIVRSASPVVPGREYVRRPLESTNMLHSSSFTHQHTNQALACLHLALTLDRHDLMTKAGHA